jgi:hypothetical protein
LTLLAAVLISVSDEKGSERALSKREKIPDGQVGLSSLTVLRLPISNSSNKRVGGTRHTVLGVGKMRLYVA